MRAAARVQELTLLAGLMAAVVALTAIGLWLSPPAQASPRASSFSTRADGGKAAFLLLKHVGYRVERSFEPLATSTWLDEDPENTTLVLASPVRAASSQDRRALRDFIDAGGTVLATAANASFFPELAGVRQPLPFEKLAARAPSRAVTADPIATGAPSIQLAPELLDVPARADGFTPIYQSADDARAVGILVRRTRGTIVWWAGSTPLTNAHIDTAGHLELLLNAVGPREGRLVVWDEYHHGFGRGLWSYIMQTPLWAALLQLTLLGLFALVTYSRRRGPIRPLVARADASSLEFVDALGALYAKARAANGAVETARAALRRRLIDAAGLSPRAADAQLAAAVAGRFPLDERLLRDLLTESAAASENRSLSSAQALPLIQRMQDAAAALRQRRTP